MILSNLLAPPTDLTVWAVEAKALQVTWGDLPAGQLRARAGSKQTVLDHPGGPGAIELHGLRPNATHEVKVVVESPDGTATSHVVTASTLKKPPGDELARIATISDLHLGTDHFGFLKTMTEPGGIPPGESEVYSVRCARTAIAAAQEWGADLLVIKGDAVHHRLDAHYELLGDLVDEFSDLEMVLLPGNHDVDKKSEIDVPESVGQRKLKFETEASAHDLPGVRLVAANTAVPGLGSGSITPTENAILELATNAPAEAGVLLACHHQFQNYRFPTYWPPGISGKEATPFLSRLDKAAPGTFVTSGHTHRCRAYKKGSLQLSEVSSTSDFPGSWAGYVVSEGGVTQTVRRIASPAEMRWLEYSKGALWGLWGRWSPGPIEQRCLTHLWED